MDSLVESVLTEAGWYRGRQVSIDTWQTYLAAEGINMVPSAISILQEFVDLTLRPKPIPGSLFMMWEIEFDPFFRDAYVTLEWTKQLGKPMCPLGRVDEDLLLIADDGGIYLDAYQALFLGDSFSEALYLMIHRNRNPKILPHIKSFDAEGADYVFNLRDSNPDEYKKLISTTDTTA